MIVKEPEATFEKILVEPGTYPARCYALIDMGTQSYEYQGETIKQRKIGISFELPLELAIFNPENGEQPFTLHKELSATLSEKGKLRPFLESWRGKDFTSEEVKGFEMKNLLDKTCMLTIKHGTSKKGNAYAEISGIGKAMKGLELPEHINPLVYFSFDEPEQKVFDGLHKFVREKIEKSPEYKVWQGIQQSPEEKSFAEVMRSESKEEDIPF